MGNTGGWGDLDTWGLAMLARARELQAHISPLLMDHATFQQFAEGRAVNEPQPGPAEAPKALTREETTLYHELINAEKGRLEQEFLPADIVRKAINEWAASKH